MKAISVESLLDFCKNQKDNSLTPNDIMRMNFIDVEAPIRVIDKDSEIPKVKPFDWDLELHGKPYYVCRIPGYVHSIAWNGGQETYQELWCYPRDEKPTHQNLVEYSLKSPVAWGVEYKEDRRIKTKWDETETRSNAHTVITRNGKPFYTVGGGMNYSLPKAVALISDIQEHPLEFNSIDFDKKMIGRKIWYNGIPGVITSYIHGQCCIMIAREDKEPWPIPAEFDSEELYYESNELKIDCLESNRIWWFRDSNKSLG